MMIESISPCRPKRSAPGQPPIPFALVDVGAICFGCPLPGRLLTLAKRALQRSVPAKEATRPIHRGLDDFHQDRLLRLYRHTPVTLLVKPGRTCQVANHFVVPAGTRPEDAPGVAGNLQGLHGFKAHLWLHAWRLQFLVPVPCTPFHVRSQDVPVCSCTPDCSCVQLVLRVS